MRWWLGPLPHHRLLWSRGGCAGALLLLLLVAAAGIACTVYYRGATVTVTATSYHVMAGGQPAGQQRLVQHHPSHATQQHHQTSAATARPSPSSPGGTADVDMHWRLLPPVRGKLDSWRRKYWRNLTDLGEGEGEDTFTVQMLTYDRMDILPTALRHYASSPHVDRIVLQWNNVHTDPPAALLHTGNDTAYHGKLHIEVQRQNKLTNRMRLSKLVRTQCVLFIDDDLIVPHEDLAFAFRTWRRMPQHVVGFTPRAHEYDPDTRRYRYVPHLLENGSYSIVLTNVAFIHRLYYDMFARVIPRAVYRMIDELTNCEDLVINAFVTMLMPRRGGGGTTGGRLVRPQASGAGVKQLRSAHHKGLWLRGKAHYRARDHCVDSLLKSYGERRALRYTDRVYRADGEPGRRLNLP